CLIPANTLVLEYVKSKCGEKVKRIQGERSVIDFRAEESDPQGSVQVTFSAQRDSPSSADRVHVDFVKQRFLTFYQRTASDLQQTSVCLAPHTPEELQRKFLSPTSQSSGKGPVNKVPPCPICMELVPPQRKKTLQCKHSFCKDCLKRRIKRYSHTSLMQHKRGHIGSERRFKGHGSKSW
uniref:RING-type domain-containing protein n=1 Tax=Fundulus heteroclitus TaxID=8078 RepID=A0A3Q2QSC6_FUNHE